MADTAVEIQRYLDRPLDELMQELAVYHEQATGATRGPADAWERLVPALRQRVCVEGNWCERRQDARFDEPINLIALLVSILAPMAGQLHIPAALIAVILFKRGLDAFCDCPPIGERKATQRR